MPQVLAPLDVLVPAASLFLKQPCSPHAVFVPQVLAQEELLVPFLMQTS